MQKTRDAEHAAALAMLKAALPAEVKIVGRGQGGQFSLLEIRAPSIEPVPVQLVESLEEAVSVTALPIVILLGSRRAEHDRLRRAGSSFVDLLGVVHLRAPGLYIDRTDLASALGSSTSGILNPYTDNASRVVRVLLTSPRARRWTTGELAAAAEVDVSTASRVVRELRRRDLALDEAPGQGRTSRIAVVDPTALLHDWTRRYSWADNRELRVAAPVGSVHRFFARMGDLFAGRRWALSLHAGASLLAPHAEFDLVHVYVDGSSEALAMEKGWGPSPSGKLVLLEPAYATSVWFQQLRMEGANVVSAVQLVLDLWHYPVRGREQAEHIIETMLRPVWESNVES